MCEAFEQYLLGLVRETSAGSTKTNHVRLVTDPAPGRPATKSRTPRPKASLASRDPLTSSSDHTLCPSEHSLSSLFDSSNDELLGCIFDSSFGEEHFVASRWEIDTHKRDASSAAQLPSIPKRTTTNCKSKKRGNSSSPPTEVRKQHTPSSVPPRKSRSAPSIQVPLELSSKSLKSSHYSCHRQGSSRSLQSSRTASPIKRVPSAPIDNRRRLSRTSALVAAAVFTAASDEDESLEGSGHIRRSNRTGDIQNVQRSPKASSIPLLLPPPPPSASFSTSPRMRKVKPGGSPRRVVAKKPSPPPTLHRSPLRSPTTSFSRGIKGSMLIMGGRQRSQRTLQVVDQSELREQYREQLNVVF